MHLAPISDFEVQREDPSLVCGHRGLEFVRGPCEVIAIVVEADVRILTPKVSAALAVRENLLGPREDAFGCLAVERVPGTMPPLKAARHTTRGVLQHPLQVAHD